MVRRFVRSKYLLPIGLVLLIAVGVRVLFQSMRIQPPEFNRAQLTPVTEVDDSGVVQSFTGAELALGIVRYPGSFANEQQPEAGVGLVADIASAAFGAVGVKTSYEVLPLPRAARALEMGQYKAILGSTRWLDEAADFHYIKLFSGPLKFYYLRERYPEAIPFGQIGDLKNYRIAVLRGSVAADRLRGADIHLILVDSIDSGLRMLSSGRADLVPLGETGAEKVLEHLYPEQRQRFATLEKPLDIVSVGLIVSPSETQLAQMFYTGLQQILTDGRYQQLIDKHQAQAWVSQELK